MLVLQLLMSGPPALLFPILGIIVGHIYYFLIEVIPLQFHYDPIVTPGFLIDFFGRGHTGITAVPPPGARTDGGSGGGGGGYQWGSGRTLGAN